jgi:hypothetical protein
VKPTFSRRTVGFTHPTARQIVFLFAMISDDKIVVMNRSISPIRHAWRTHRQEFLPPLVATVVYLLALQDVEPSRATRGLLFLILVFPPITVGRMAYTAWKHGKGSR